MAEAMQATATHNEPVNFIPVKLTEPTTSNLTVWYREDWRIEVVSGLDPHLLQQVIDVLRAS